MPIVQNNINRVNRMIENILDQPIVIRVMSPMQPIANTLTTRYLDYAMPSGDGATANRPVSYAIVNSDGDVAWSGDTELLSHAPDLRRSNQAASPVRSKPVSYSILDASGNLVWEGDTDLLPAHLQQRNARS